MKAKEVKELLIRIRAEAMLMVGAGRMTAAWTEWLRKYAQASAASGGMLRARDAIREKQTVTPIALHILHSKMK